jgi:hypothetical protein
MYFLCIDLKGYIYVMFISFETLYPPVCSETYSFTCVNVVTINRKTEKLTEEFERKYLNKIKDSQ